MSRGGPSKMTPETEERILSLMARGMSQARATELLDVHETTLRRHCAKHPEFASRLRQARLNQESSLIERCATGQKGWQGAAWLLSKQHPDRYGKKVDEAPPVIQPVQIITETITRESHVSDTAQGTPAAQ